MKITDIIEKKKTGKILTEEEIKFFVQGVTNGTIEDYQTSALLMSLYFTGMNIEETTLLTKYMAQSGEMLDLSEISDKIIDKHSTGGVGDKVTLLFLSIMAAAGLYTAKLSGRGLGHTGGTIDKLDSIPNFRTNLTIKEFKEQVKTHFAAITAQTLNLAPADGKLYALRDVTSTIDILPLIASSIVSKKIASGANYIILDVKCGKGAFIKTFEDAKRLSEIMVETGKRLNRNISAVISDMNRPLGRAIGNSIEVQEAVEFLKGNMEEDLKEVTYALCLKALEKTGRLESGKYLDELIMSGKALEKFRDIIKAQGGDVSVLDDFSKFPQALVKHEVKAPKAGFINDTDALKIAKACKNLGAGREKKSDKIDYSAGVYLTKKYSEYVQKGETIAILYTNDISAIKECEKLVLSAYSISDKKPEKQNIVFDIIN